MKVKIKKQGKVKSFKLISSWSDVTLEKWLKLVDFHNGTKSNEALETIAELSNIPKDLISQLELRDIVVMMGSISELQAKQDSSLKRIIEIEGKRYGFHPNLDEITLGEYADLEQFIKLGIEKHLPEIVAVLYRPIVEENNGVYTIAAYDGDISIRAEEMKKMSAEQVQSALVFFYHFVSVLLMTSQSSLTTRLKEMKMQLPQNPLARNGHGSV
jgi:hypothetical protein|tara:strand:- start:684 stop:1325 length:642 start_codon:yes stop_codon:yes gene_type:complete